MSRGQRQLIIADQPLPSAILNRQNWESGDPKKVRCVYVAIA